MLFLSKGVYEGFMIPKGQFLRNAESQLDVVLNILKQSYWTECSFERSHSNKTFFALILINIFLFDYPTKQFSIKLFSGSRFVMLLHYADTNPSPLSQLYVHRKFFSNYNQFPKENLTRSSFYLNSSFSFCDIPLRYDVVFNY